MNSSVTTPRVAQLLDALYADAAKVDPLVRNSPRDAGIRDDRRDEFLTSMRLAYMAVNRDFGRLMYTLARSSRVKTIVEFGTSFGVSTIFLASAIHDNGSGRLITTEFDAAKAERAKSNLKTAGLDDCVEFRIGDARETLKVDAPGEIDMLFLDGPKPMYLDVLRLLEPRLSSGCIIASDNTDDEGLKPFLEYVRDAKNGYVSSALLTPSTRGPRAHEISLRG